MLRGYTLFRCSDCGKTFMAPDVELNATTLSAPQPCPQCGSMHTQALKDLPSSIIRNIWEKIKK